LALNDGETNSSMGMFGPKICALIYEPQLLAELTALGIPTEGARVTFDGFMPEGGAAIPYLDGWLGDFSDIGVLDDAGREVGGGSITYVFSDSSESAEPIVWWESFFRHVDDWVIPVAHYNFGIPNHVWERLSSEARAHYASKGKRRASNRYGPNSTQPDAKGWRRQV
jgi:hypothetical protein